MRPRRIGPLNPNTSPPRRARSAHQGLLKPDTKPIYYTPDQEAEMGAEELLIETFRSVRNQQPVSLYGNPITLESDDQELSKGRREEEASTPDKQKHAPSAGPRPGCTAPQGNTPRYRRSTGAQGRPTGPASPPPNKGYSPHQYNTLQTTRAPRPPRARNNRREHTAVTGRSTSGWNRGAPTL